jgi:hypothetical protein
MLLKFKQYAYDSTTKTFKPVTIIYLINMKKNRFFISYKIRLEQ